MGRENNISKGLLIGFLTGSVVGAAIALLYAPKSGKELRQDLKDKAGEVFDEAEKYMDNAREKAMITINDGKKKAEVLITDAKAKADELIKDADRILTDAKVKATDLYHSGKENVTEEAGRIKGAVKAGLDAYKDSKHSTT